MSIPLGVLASARHAAAAGVLAEDNFDRADNPSSMGGAWATTGTWGILSGRARCYGSDLIATLDVGVSAGYRAQVDFLGVNWPGLVVRFVDPQNYYWFENSNDIVTLYRKIAGVTTPHSSSDGNYGRHTVTVEVTESAGATTFNWWTSRNPNVRTAVDSTSGRPNGTRVGMRGQNYSPSGEFDDFKVVTL